MKNHLRHVLTFAVLLATVHAVPTARYETPGGQSASSQVIAIDGSSTVFPVMRPWPRSSRNDTPARSTVGLSGTGGGFQKFVPRRDGQLKCVPADNGRRNRCVRKSDINYIELLWRTTALRSSSIEEYVGDFDHSGGAQKLWEPAAQGKILTLESVRARGPTGDSPVWRWCGLERSTTSRGDQREG